MFFYFKPNLRERDTFSNNNKIIEVNRINIKRKVKLRLKIKFDWKEKKHLLITNNKRMTITQTNNLN
jgi:hypothetical protein